MTDLKRQSMPRLFSALAAVALALGFALPYGPAPLVTFHLEWWAAAGWLLLLALAASSLTSPRLQRLDRNLVLAVPLLLVAGTVFDAISGRVVYGGVWFLVIVYLTAAALALGLGVSVGRSLHTDGPTAETRNAGSASDVLRLVAWGILAGAAINALAGTAQYLRWSAVPSLLLPMIDSERVYGNIRQANHYSLLLIMGVAALCILQTTQRGTEESTARLWRLRMVISAVLGAACALSASRSGAVMLWAMLIAALAGRGLMRRDTWLVVAAVAGHAFAWWLAVKLDEWGVLPFYAVFRPTFEMGGATDGRGLSTFRFEIWQGLLNVIGASPWTGYGTGLLNHAYLMTEVPKRVGLNLQNAHNLPLHVAVEHGVPLMLAWLGAIGWLAWRARAAWRDRVARSVALMLVPIAVHSGLEYPLWYLYFLLPFSFAAGVYAGVGVPAQADPPATAAAGPRMGYFVILAGAAILGAVWIDYSRIAPAFQPNDRGPDEAMRRIELGYRSQLFRNVMDFAVVRATPVNAGNARKHHDLSEKVLRDRATPEVLLNLAISSTLLGHPDEARTYLLKMQEVSREGFADLMSKLYPEERQVLAPVLATLP